MIKYSYNELEDEVIENNETVKRTATRSQNDATVEDIINVIRKLDAKGFDLTVSIKTKMSKG